MAGRTRTRKNRREGKTCGAKNPRGLPCQCKLTFKAGRCRWHGGLSLDKADKERITRKTGRVFKKTGPATEAGKQRSYPARNAGRDRYWRALSLRNILSALPGRAGD